MISLQQPAQCFCHTKEHTGLMCHIQGKLELFSQHINLFEFPVTAN